MASNVPYVPSDLSKLTVPQLKALCKERRITGYSKLTKAALLQKLAEVAAPSTTTTPPNDQTSRNAPSTAPANVAGNTADNPACIESSTACWDGDAAKVVHQPVQPLTAGNTNSLTEASTVKVFLPTVPPRSSHNRTVTSATSTQKTSGAKGPAHTDTSAILKRIPTSLKPATNAGHQPPVLRTSTFQQRTLPGDSSAPTNDQANRNVTTALSITPADGVQNVQPLAASNGIESTEPSTAKVPLPTEPPKSMHNRSVASTEKTSGVKRPAHTDISATPKRIKTSFKPVTNAGPPPVPRTSTFQQKTLPVESSAFKVPEQPPQPKRPVHGGASTTAVPKQPSAASKGSVMALQTRGRFRPLVVSKPRPVAPDQASGEPSPALVVAVAPRAVDSALVFDIHATSLPVLPQISLPPKASERKWVYWWAIILSALSPEDKQTCMLVSRTFRYAVYLSATHILSRDFPGRRLDTILEQHPRNMTNLWPYLRFRAMEVSERRRTFKQSFLGQYTNSIRYDPLSERIWTSPDDERQVDIALRFVLTRMWFAVSVGAYGHDASTWSTCVVRDVREVVQGEVWQVTARDHGTSASCSFYVLEATCEVIGQPPSSEGQDTLGYGLRADWTAWISERTRVSPDAASSLLAGVKWAHTEDYYRGISKAWLRRVQGQDADSVAKRTVAERYILASVVANGISGQWMSTSAMAQEFAGLPGKGALVAGRSVNTVNMYLPAHHHIESVHFTTSRGEALHGAVAVVQTPGREYYVLRDNGMQVGCEEEGIPEVWQRILGCDAVGRAH